MGWRALRHDHYLLAELNRLGQANRDPQGKIMNTYWITYRGPRRGAPVSVEAETVDGFTSSTDSYVFKVGDEVVAAIPKDMVISIKKSERSG